MIIGPRPSLHIPSLKIQGNHLLVGAILVILGYLVLVPLILLILSGFKSTGFIFDPGLTLKHFVKVYSDQRTFMLILNTLIFAIGSLFISLGLGILFAWLTDRTNLPLRSVVRVSLILPMAFPGILLAMGWLLLASPRNGMINQYLMALFGLRNPPFNIFSFSGMIFVQGLFMTPTVYLIVSPLFRRMDPLLEEASSVAGANNFTTVRYVIFPLLFPGILAAAAYVFLVNLAVFDVPGTLGIPARISVFSSEILWWAKPSAGIPNYGRVGALASIFLIAALALGIFYSYTTRKMNKFTTVTGKGYHPKLLDLGRWKYLALGGILFYLVLSMVLPFLTLLWMSLIPFIQPFSLDKLHLVSLANYRITLGLAKVQLAITNTFLVVLITSVVAAVFSTIISWLIVHTRGFGRWALDLLAYLPIAIPHVMLGLALIYVYLTIQFLPVYGTVWILIIAYVTTYLAFGTRTTNAAMFQLHKELEEAAHISGASRLQTLRTIVMPIIRPATLNVFVWVAAHSMRELSAAMMLRSSKSMVMSSLIWEFWSEDAELSKASLLGVMLILMLFILTIGFLLVQRTTKS